MEGIEEVLIRREIEEIVYNWIVPIEMRRSLSIESILARRQLSMYKPF